MDGIRPHVHPRTEAERALAERVGRETELIDLRPLVEAFRPIVAQFQAFADALSAAFPGPHLPGLLALARANDLTIAQRRGEKPCAGSHDALAAVCGHCGAAL